MSKNINISFDLLNSAISLLEDIDVEDYDLDFAQLFGYVSRSLKNKKSALIPCCPSPLPDSNYVEQPYPLCSQCNCLPF